MKDDNKRKVREEKRLLKQVGNQQLRTRSKRAIRKVLDGETDDIEDVDMDDSVRSKYMNGFDKLK